MSQAATAPAENAQAPASPALAVAAAAPAQVQSPTDADAAAAVSLSLVGPEGAPELQTVEKWRSEFEQIKQGIAALRPNDPSKTAANEAAELQKIAAESAARADKLAAELESLRFEKTFAREAAGMKFASDAARDDAFEAFARQYEYRDGKVFDRATGSKVFNQTSGKDATIADILNGWKANGRGFLFAQAPAAIDLNGAGPAGADVEFSIVDRDAVNRAAVAAGVDRLTLLDAIAKSSGLAMRYQNGETLKLSEIRGLKK